MRRSTTSSTTSEVPTIEILLHSFSQHDGRRRNVQEAACLSCLLPCFWLTSSDVRSLSREQTRRRLRLRSRYKSQQRKETNHGLLISIVNIILTVETINTVSMEAKQTKIHELSAENTRSMNMWQFEKNLVHEFVKEAEIIDLKETVSKQEIRELENDLVTKNEELRLIRRRESEGLQKIKELEQVVKTLGVQKTRRVDTDLKHRT
ncbi:hypothetical protein VTO58DRAFT_102347 [Aureobasidium pullulans]